MNKGIFLALGAYLLWGFLPIYWKLLKEVPPLQILSHRIIWSLFFISIFLFLKKDWSWISSLRKNPRNLLYFCGISTLIALNWFTYIWGVNNNYIVETSLGYFLNPLVNILLGIIFLKEKPRSTQWLAIAFAFIGVAYLTYTYGRVPWISLILAGSFGVYGLLKKVVQMGPLRGLALETAILSPLALSYLMYQDHLSSAVFLNSSIQIDLLLICGGIVTSLPLLLFAAATKKISMTVLGSIQYVAPTIQFLLGVLVYGETFSSEQLYGFTFIWIALIIFTIDLIRSSRKRTPLPASF